MNFVDALENAECFSRMTLIISSFLGHEQVEAKIAIAGSIDDFIQANGNSYSFSNKEYE